MPNISRRFRQLMGFIYDDDAMLWENGTFALTAVDGVRQQKIMVTDLEHISIRVAAFQKALVPAVLIITVAELRNADMFPVITAEMGDIAHVQRYLQRAKGVGGCRIFLFESSPDEAAFAGVRRKHNGLCLCGSQRATDGRSVRLPAGCRTAAEGIPSARRSCKAMLEVEVMTACAAPPCRIGWAAAAAR